ncbi:Hypothetical protein NGAL_HAMBI2605_64560 [Neorhizobium galegae bv. orientalis]|nr:Hypothetical protein NGAL_HAMBI2605_64560 [Neorhizobium galegae bv. orientalis]
MVKQSDFRDATYPPFRSNQLKHLNGRAIETVMRYANVFDCALSLISSGKVDLKPLISYTYGFSDAVQAFERAASARPSHVKIHIRVSENQI